MVLDAAGGPRRTGTQCMPAAFGADANASVMGLTLTLALIYINDRIEPRGSPVRTSQIAGIAKPFEPEPERSTYTVTGSKFRGCCLGPAGSSPDHRAISPEIPN